MIEETALVHDSPSRHRWSKRALGYTLAGVCLYWVLRDLDVRELLRRIAEMDLLWMAAAIVFDVLSYLCQGLRGSYFCDRLGKSLCCGAHRLSTSASLLTRCCR